jgi:hypothetical protein
MRAIADIETDLRDACVAVRAQGWILTRDITTSLPTKRCCALGAYSRVNGLDPGPGAAGRGVGLDEDHVDAFTSGFDGYSDDFARASCGRELRPTEREVFLLGRRLATEFIDGQVSP